MLPVNKTLITRSALEDLNYKIYTVGLSKSKALRQILGEELPVSRPSVLKVLELYRTLDLEAPATHLVPRVLPRWVNYKILAVALIEAKATVRDSSNTKQVAYSLATLIKSELSTYYTVSYIYNMAIASLIIYESKTVREAVSKGMFLTAPGGTILKTDKCFVGSYPVGYWR